ncbi:MAG: DMT family transporter [Bacteroidota bacterium]|nr:DMT family transporter [Bacteroidota bacterium]
MLNLLFTILLFNLLIILFKIFKKYHVNTLQALTVNYFISAILACIYIEDKINIVKLLESEWIPHALTIGALFIIVFYIYSYGVQNIGISVTTLANKMSVVIPVTAALILYPNETLTLTKLTALMLAFIGIYFSSLKNNKINFRKKILWLILLIFFSQGVVDAIFNDFFQTYRKENDYLFFMVLFLTAGFTGCILIILESIKTSFQLEFKVLIWGIIFAIPNFFSLIFFIKALNEVESSIVYPLASIGIIISSTLLGMFIFKEKINRNNWLGIIICAIAIYLFS